jgi:hypothetical protein
MFHFDESSTVGFSGSRAPSIASMRALRLALATLPSEAPAARVFRANDYGVGRAALAARSIACVRAVAAAGGVWVSLPDAVCPARLRPSPSPSACFAGYGSGSWASLALAVGLQTRALVFLPPGVSVPVGWPLVALAEGWFGSVPAASQLSLFIK